MNVQPTHTYETAPRDLDILVIGGPNPGTVPEASLTFLREAAKQTKIILTTCTGGMWLAKSGVLDGKKATTNRQALEVSKQFFPKVEWLDQRWVIEDGLFEGAKIWTGGGAGCGESSSLSILICVFVCADLVVFRHRYVYRVYGPHFQQEVGTAGLCWIGLSL